MSQQQCEELPRAVWLRVAGRDFCMRYYLSMAGGPGTRAFVFLQGDRLGRLNGATGEFSPGPRDRDVDTSDFNKVATALSQQAGMPGDLSGAARPRRLLRQSSHSPHHARTARRQRRARRDQGAAPARRLPHDRPVRRLDPDRRPARTALGSGLRGDRRRRAVLSRRTLRSSDPARDYFNAAEAVGAIARNRATRASCWSPIPPTARCRSACRPNSSTAAARRRPVEQFLVQAIDEDRHGVLSYARTAALGCLRGASTDEIEQRLAQQVERALAAKASDRRAECRPSNARRRLSIAGAVIGARDLSNLNQLPAVHCAPSPGSRNGPRS